MGKAAFFDNERKAARRAPAQLLRLPEVLERVGCGKTQLYAMIKAGTFPRGVRLSQRWAAWPAAEVDRWIREQTVARPDG